MRCGAASTHRFRSVSFLNPFYFRVIVIVNAFPFFRSFVFGTVIFHGVCLVPHCHLSSLPPPWSLSSSPIRYATRRDASHIVVLGIVHEFRQVLRLHQDGVEIRIGEPDGFVDSIRVREACCGLEFRPGLSNDKVLSIGSGHLHGSPHEFSVQGKGLGPGGRSGHGGWLCSVVAWHSRRVSRDSIVPVLVDR